MERYLKISDAIPESDTLNWVRCGRLSRYEGIDGCTRCTVEARDANERMIARSLASSSVRNARRLLSGAEASKELTGFLEYTFLSTIRIDYKGPRLGR